MNDLIDQPTSRTNRKVRNASWTAAWVAPVAAISAGMFTDLMFPELSAYHMHFEFLATLAITGVGTWWVGYQTRERAE